MTARAVRSHLLSAGSGLLAVVLVASLALVTLSSPASAAVSSYTNPTYVSIPELGVASPNPTNFTVPVDSGRVTEVSLVLHQFTHFYAYDVQLTLTAPDGRSLVITCENLPGHDGTQYGSATGGDYLVSDAAGNTCRSLAFFNDGPSAGVWSLDVVDTIGEEGGSFAGGVSLNLATVDPAPASVVTGPTDHSTTSGTPVTFTSTGAGEPAPSIQWQIADPATPGVFTDIAGANSPNLTVTPVFADNGNRYRVSYSNDLGDQVSDPATLVVAALPPAVTVHPVEQTVDSGSSVTFTSAATGDPTPTVQWEVLAPGASTPTAISGATATSLVLDAVDLADDNNRYRAVYTNVGGTMTTGYALLTVKLIAPVVTENPSDSSVGSGDQVTFTAHADSEVVPTIQWQVSTDGAASFSILDGETSNELSFTGSFDQDQNQYRAVFTNSTGQAMTSAATLTVTALAPTVTTDPEDVIVVEGQPATFIASASGDPVAATQWEVSADAGVTYATVAGAVSGSYTIPVTHRTEDGNLYRAVFTNLDGAATTQPALLTVHTVPAITVDPEDVTAASGQSVTLTAGAVGNPEPTVQWQLDSGEGFADVEHETSRTLSLAATEFADSGNRYRAVFTNAAGSATTAVATLTVVPGDPVVTSNPESQTALAGTEVTFSATATGDPTPTVQWQLSTPDGEGVFTDIDGAVSPSYTFTTAAVDDGNLYQAVFINAGASTVTEAAALTVIVATVVTDEPDDTTVQEGTRASFTAAASGQPSPSVQWQRSTDEGLTYTDIQDATAETYTVLVELADDDNLYRAVFTNAGGEATSRVATLLVEEAEVPSAPLGFTVVQTGPGQVTMTWTSPASDGSSRVTGYVVGYGQGEWGNGQEVGSEVRAFVFDDLQPGVYTFIVRAVNDKGFGEGATEEIQVLAAADDAPGAPVSPDADADQALPTTGGDVGLLALLAALLFGFGVTLTASSRRRTIIQDQVG